MSMNSKSAQFQNQLARIEELVNALNAANFAAILHRESG
jgi:hypothetical protein